MGRRRIQRCMTPELKDILVDPNGGKWFRPINSADEVFPGVILGDADTALSTVAVKDLGITHVLNAAHGQNHHGYGGYVSTSPTYYAKLRGIKYLGVPAMDMPGFYIKPYLRDAADFIDNALKSGGRVLVHCQCGISRSAALVAAFLMLKKGMNIQTALATIKKKRSIFPNQGFLSQLCDLDYELRRSGALPADNPELRPLSPERETSPFRNPKTYPRFSLVPNRVLDTYTDTKNYVVPRRATSAERYVPPRTPFQNNPLVDSSRGRSPARSVSPVPHRRPSLSSYMFNDDEDEDEIPVNPKVFDTYRRYGRSSTSPLPSTTTTYFSPERTYYPYLTPRAITYDTYHGYPSTWYYDRYWSLPTYEYMNNLNKYYDLYKFNKSVSPFSASGTTVAPATTVYRTYKVFPGSTKAYLVGTSSTAPSFPYPYTEKYYPTIYKYPATWRVLGRAY